MQKYKKKCGGCIFKYNCYNYIPYIPRELRQDESGPSILVRPKADQSASRLKLVEIQFRLQFLRLILEEIAAG